jgi:hypothetical protein
VNSAQLAVALVDALDDAAIDRLLDRASEDSLSRLAIRLKPHLGETQPDRWLTTAQAAAHLGCTPNALHKLTAARLVPFEQDRPGGKLYFKRSRLDAWRESGGAAVLSDGRCASKTLPTAVKQGPNVPKTQWARRVSNLRPLACEAYRGSGRLPLCRAESGRFRRLSSTQTSSGNPGVFGEFRPTAFILPAAGAPRRERVWEGD